MIFFKIKIFHACQRDDFYLTNIDDNVGARNP